MKNPHRFPVCAGKFRRAAALALSLFLPWLGALAQSPGGSLTGKILGPTGTPLSGVIVTLVGTGLEGSTDREGDYYFGAVPAGTYTAHLNYLGMPPKDMPVTIGAGRATLNATLGIDVVQLQAFTVEGTRAGQARALNEQRASENLREVIASDAIGRFPDHNASETLQRMSSIALERDQGDGRFVSIRGMYGDLNSTQLNGVNIPSSENGTRRVNFDSIPTEILDGIEVTKAVTPDMDADAIGGSINLKTKTAFSQEGRLFNLSAEGVYNDYSKKWGHKFGATYGQRFGGDRWGVVFSLSDAVKSHKALDSEMGSPLALKGGFLVPDGNIDIREYAVQRIRQGGSASLDFHPTKDDTFYLRGTYNHFSDTENRFRELFRNTAATTTVIDATHGTVAGRPLLTDIKDRTEDQNFGNINFGGEHHRGGLQIDYVAAFALAELTDPRRSEYVFQSPNTSFTYDFTNPWVPKMGGTYATAITPNNFTLNSHRIRRALQQDKERTLSLNVRGETKFGELPGYWKVGAKYRGREKTSDTDDFRYNANAAVNLGTLDLARLSSFRTGSTNPFITVDPVKFDNYFRGTPGAFVLNPITSAFGTKSLDYTTNENVTAAYAMASVTNGNLTILGGLRLEQTEFKTQGYTVNLPNTAAQTFTPTTIKTSYTNWLPGLHARYKLGKQAQIRASFNQSLARPNYGDSAGTDSLDPALNLETKGNPKLKPYEANNFDVSIEFYPKALGVWSAGVFAKDIKNFIFRQTLAGRGQGGLDLSTPLNGPKATIRGLELTWQQNLTMLPSPFNGLGFYTNYTITDSDANYGAARPGEHMPFSRQSKAMGNFAVSYEKYGFFLRVAANYRTPYIEDGGIGSGPATDTWVSSHLQVDITTNYQITKRLTVYGEFLNVNEEPYIMHWAKDSTLLRKAEYYKFGANIGVRFRL
ncbi:MAG: TonB-dependent receptor [Opitutus sp.]|nr:TonB-dependent receptor [Opitutus sp.]